MTNVQLLGLADCDGFVSFWRSRTYTMTIPGCKNKLCLSTPKWKPFFISETYVSAVTVFTKVVYLNACLRLAMSMNLCNHNFSCSEQWQATWMEVNKVTGALKCSLNCSKSLSTENTFLRGDSERLQKDALLLERSHISQDWNTAQRNLWKLVIPANCLGKCIRQPYIKA